MIKNNKTNSTTFAQVNEVKSNRKNSTPYFVDLTAGTRQHFDPQTSEANSGTLYYPEFDGSVRYKTSRAFALPSKPGVYFIHDFRGILYIGEAKNLRQRFLQHHRNEDNAKLKKLVSYPFGDLCFFWINTETKLKAVKIQKRWIRVFQPISNNIKYNKDRG